MSWQKSGDPGITYELALELLPGARLYVGVDHAHGQFVAKFTALNRTYQGRSADIETAIGHAVLTWLEAEG